MYLLCIHWDIGDHVYIMIINANTNYSTTNTDVPKFTLAIYSVDQPKRYTVKIDLLI